MKNLKKVLALVLVVATLMGFATVAGAKTSDFTDAASISNKEAVDVMTAIGVIVGKPGGGFDPNGNVTRAEMAKMIAYIMNGGEDVGPLYSAANVFADCGYHWARGYIAYAANVKLIVGVGNNKFNPDGNVTGVEAAKMLVCALGYEAEREGIEGATWASKTLSLAKEVGLTEGFASNFDFSRPLSRDGAAQMMLNALKAPTVTYSDDKGSITIDGTVINLGGNRSSFVITNEKYQSAISGKKVPSSENANGIGGTMLELGEKSFEGDLRLDDDATDAFGRPAHTWTYDREEIDTYTDTPDLTYTAEVKAREIYNDLGKVKIDAGHVHTWEDGKANAAVDGTAESSLVIASGNDTKYGGAGTLVEVYLGTEDKTPSDDTQVDCVKIVIINTYVGEINSFTRAKTDKNGNVTDDAYITITPSSVAPSNLNAKYESDDYSKDDEEKVVLYTVAWNADTSSANKNEIQSVAYPETAEGVMSRFTSSDLTVDGTKYNRSENSSDALIACIDDEDFDGTYTFYLDTYGNVIRADLREAGATSYVYLERVKNTSDTFDATTGVRAYVVHTDGTHEVVDVATRKPGNSDPAGVQSAEKVCDLPAAGANTVVATDIDDVSTTSQTLNTWIGYTVNSKGEYTFKSLDSDRAVVLTVTGNPTRVLTSKSATISGVGATQYYLNSDTVVVNIDEDYKLTTFTGLPKRDAKFDNGTQLLVTHSKGSYAANGIYVAAQSKGLSNENVTYAYAVERSGSSGGDDEWKFVVDGKIQFYTNGNNLPLASGQIYDLTLSDNEISSADPADGYDSDTVVEYAKRVLSVEDAGALTVADDCVIYDVNDHSDLPGEAGDDVDVLTSLDAGDVVGYVVDDSEVVIIFRTALAPEE